MHVISRDIASLFYLFLSMETLVKERWTTVHLGVNVTDVSMYENEFSYNIQIVKR